jgi:hypothetical protein
MPPERGESRVAASGVVMEALWLGRGRSATARVEGERPVQPAGGAAAAAIATEAGADTSARSTADPVRSVVRDLLGRFLRLNEQVNEFVNRYIEVFVEQPDGLTAWLLEHRAGRITDSIASMDRAVVNLLQASEAAGVGPNEVDRTALGEYREQLRTVQYSLNELRGNAGAHVADSESRQASYDRLRTLTEKTWQATTGLFKIASATVTQLLDEIPQWAVGSGTISGAVQPSARDSKSESAAQVAVNK